MVEVIHVRGRPASQRPDTGLTCDVRAHAAVHEHALSSEAAPLVVPELLPDGGRLVVRAAEARGPDIGPALLQHEVGNRPPRSYAFEARRNWARRGSSSSAERQTGPDSASHNECEEPRKRQATSLCSSPSLRDYRFDRDRRHEIKLI